MNNSETMEYTQLRSFLMMPMSEKSHPVVARLLNYCAWVSDPGMETLMLYDVESRDLDKLPKRLRNRWMPIRDLSARYEEISRYIDSKIEANLKIPIKTCHYISSANEYIRRCRRVTGVKGLLFDSYKEL